MLIFRFICSFNFLYSMKYVNNSVQSKSMPHSFFTLPQNLVFFLFQLPIYSINFFFFIFVQFSDFLSFNCHFSLPTIIFLFQLSFFFEIVIFLWNCQFNVCANTKMDVIKNKRNYFLIDGRSFGISNFYKIRSIQLKSMEFRIENANFNF